MISIITAIHNGIEFNQLYYHYLKKYTANEFELIIIDNNSTDGSKQFFESVGATVIVNDQNYSYPFCQNQGIAVAKSPYLFFLNNDIIVSPGWDEKLLKVADLYGLDILSAAGVENLGDFISTRFAARKWKRSKNMLLSFGFGKRNLLLMLRMMYGNWEKFCEKRFKQFGYTVKEGIVGNNVMMTRKAIDAIGLWDERLQSADFDLFMRSKKRALEGGDIQPAHIALGVLIHHYIRMTSKYAVKPKPFADRDKLIDLKDKWSMSELTSLHPANATLKQK